MKTRFRRSALTALQSVALFAAAACDVHIDCAETQTCAGPRARDAGSTDAGTTVDAGDPGPLTCAPGTGNCDGARFNGCEVDLTTDVSHCGACGAACDGACRGARCAALQVIATNQRHYPLWGGIGFDASRVYWASTANVDAAAMTWRIQSAPKAGGAVTQGPPSHPVSQLFVGNGVLFTRSPRSPAIFMLSLDGSSAQPIISMAAAYDYYAGELVWTEDIGGAINISKLDEATLTKTALSAGFANEPRSSISFHEDVVAYADAENVSYYLAGAGTASISPHAGLFGRLRVDRSDSLGRIVWSDSMGLSQVEVKGPARTRQSLVYVSEVLDFALTAGGDIYYAWETPQNGSRGISLLRKDEDAPSLVAVACGRSLEVDGDYLYFFDCDKQRLVRLALEAE